jgi:hypothetical protein
MAAGQNIKHVLWFLEVIPQQEQRRRGLLSGHREPDMVEDLVRTVSHLGIGYLGL